MKLSDKISKDHLHHAYLIEAKREDGLEAFQGLMGELGIATKGNPDFHEYIFNALLLEHARLLRSEQSFYGADGAKKIFFVAFNTIGHEAQNALLKTLEEPTDGTHFFFVTDTRESLLPTFLSRVQVISYQSSTTPLSGLGETALMTDSGVRPPSSEKSEGEIFLAATVVERMKFIEVVTKAKGEDKPKAKEDARLFLESLEHALYEIPKSEKIQGLALGATSSRPDLVFSASITSALQNVVIAKRHLSGTSPSLKLLLEHLALTTPKNQLNKEERQFAS